MDVGIIAQFFYYTLKNKTQHPLPSSWSAAALVVAFPLTSHSLGNLKFNSTAEEIGYLVGLCSTCFYLGSRLPQIIKNFKRGKTEGVHPFTFLLAVVANVAYASSVLLSKADDGQSYKTFVMEHLPWLLGSLGTVLLDFTVCIFIIQFFTKFRFCCNACSSENRKDWKEKRFLTTSLTNWWISTVKTNRFSERHNDLFLAINHNKTQ